MANGQVDIRVMKKTGKARLRFYDVYPDLLEIILTALEKARKEGNTHSDTVALSYICMDFIAAPAKTGEKGDMKSSGIDEKWSVIIKANEIPSKALGDEGERFVRGVTLQIQEEGDLSQRQWVALERIIQRHGPKHDFDPTTLGSGQKPVDQAADRNRPFSKP